MPDQSQNPKRFSRYLEQFLYIWDLLIINIAFLIGVYLRLGNFQILQDKNYQLLIILGNVIWLVLISYKKGLKRFRVERIESTLRKSLFILLMHFGILSALVLFLNFDSLSRLSFLYFYLGFTLLIILSRAGVFFFLKRYRARGFNFRRVIIIGCEDAGQRIGNYLSKDLSFGYKVMGYFDDTQPSVFTGNYLGSFNQIEKYIQSSQVDEMYVALHYDQNDIIDKLIGLSEKYLIRIKFIPDFRAYTKTRRVNIDFYDGIPVMMLRKEPLENPINRLVKKAFDMIFALLGILLIFSWLFPILSVLIKLSSKGPIFFIQERSGEDNRAFKCFKFRTMKINNDADNKQASKGDTRITGIGAFMRKTNLDELPQFFNVLLGNMSVVGPRPHMLMHTEEYRKRIDNYLVRHYAKPGITGWAQVNGFRGETKTLDAMEDRVKHDIYYIENWSFLLDLKIVWLTVWNMVKGEENAY